MRGEFSRKRRRERKGAAGDGEVTTKGGMRYAFPPYGLFSHQRQFQSRKEWWCVRRTLRDLSLLYS
jgi:hypothetical protein